MGTLAKIILGPIIVIGAIMVAVAVAALMSQGVSSGTALTPFAIVGTGFAIIYLRRRRHVDASTAPTGSTRTRQHHLIEQAPDISSEAVFKGHGATVVLHEDIIAIHRHGAASFVLQGLKGEKRIPFRSISAVQFRPAGRQMSGYIQFSILGGIESRAGILDATLDENSVMFTPEQNARFELLRDLVETRCRRAQGPAQAAPASIADELGKLAELRQRGLLSADEFDLQKQRLLSS